MACGLTGGELFCSPRHGPHLARRGPPDCYDRKQIASGRDPKGDRVSAGNVIKHAGNPRSRSSAEDRCDHYSAEDAPVMAALENLGGYRPHHRGQAISERPLGEDHRIEQCRSWRGSQSDQRQIADHEAQISDHPDPFSPYPVGQMTQRDLTRYRYKAHQSQRPSSLTRLDPDIDQIFRLVNLDGIPRIKAAEIAAGQPPKPPGAQCPSERPIDSGPGVVYHVRSVAGGLTARDQTIRTKAHLFGAVLEQQIERRQQHEQQNAERDAGGPPSRCDDQPAQPRQNGDRADADARERDAEREAAPADKPIRQINRLARIGEAIDATADKSTQRQVELPRLSDQARKDQARSHCEHTKLDHDPRTPQIHQAAHKGREDSRNEKPEREGAGGYTSVPPEFGEDCREQQREGGARIDPDGHRDECHRDEEPAVEKRDADAARSGRKAAQKAAIIHGSTRLSGVSPTATRRRFSAISFTRLSSIPSVQPEMWGVINTFGKS